MNILILGGSGGIGSALINQILTTHPNAAVFATYRSHRPSLVSERVHWFQTDISSESDVQSLAENVPALDMLINTVGVLHSNGNMPEKTVSAFDSGFFKTNIESNTLPTLLLAKYFQQHLKAGHSTFFVSVSARIGSIGDNKIGGWISYRCSKAALNMAIKTVSIEWKYKLPNCCIFAFHPGTTDTPLSEPFQKNVPPGKLFTADFVADSLLTLIESKTPADTGKFFSYDGAKIPW